MTMPQDFQQEFNAKLGDLMNEISTLPEGERQRLTDLAMKTKQRHDKLRQTVTDLQESLDYLRLSIKYLVFDLEATRRENAYLRQLLKEQEASGEHRDPDDHNDFGLPNA